MNEIALAAQNLYADLCDTLPIACCTLDDRGRIAEINARGAAIFGCPREALAGRPLAAAARMQDPEPLWCHLRACLASDSPVVAELVFGSVTGGEVAVQAISVRVRTEDASVRCRMVLTEVARREPELAVRARIEAVSRAQTAVCEALVRAEATDVDAVVRAIVTQARELADCELAALERVEPADRPFEPPIMATSFLAVPIVRGGRTVANLRLGAKRSGAFSDADEHAMAMLARSVAVVLELAEDRRAKADEHAWLERVLEQLPEGVVVADRTRRVHCNRAAAELGAAPAADAGVAFEAQLPTGEALAWGASPLIRALDHGDTTVRQEILLRRRDGTWGPVLVSATPVRLDEGSSGAVAVFQDLSALDALERIRNEWVSMVAHDLKQPLGAILATASNLERDSEGARPKTERIRRAAVQLTRMVDDLLDIARIELGRLTVNPEPVALAGLVPDIIDRARHLLGGSDVRLEVSPARDRIFGHVDPGRLEQILSNLLSNAAAYGEDGAEIRVRLEERPQEVLVSVLNRGPGLSEGECQRVFERAYRTPGARATRPAGLGLGLFIVRALVHAHGGRVWATSSPGEWTTFSFTIPGRGSTDRS